MIEDGSFLSLFSTWPELGKILAFVVALQVALRGLSEALIKISDFTETKWDNKVAAWFAEAAWIIGVVLGKVGYGQPKDVSKAQLDKVEAKRVEKLKADLKIEVDKQQEIKPK